MHIPRPRKPLHWILTGLAVIVVLAVGGPFVYIHFFNGSTPAALSLPTASATASTAVQQGSISGTWNATSGSVVGYRVNEVLLGQNTTAVGRSASVTGHLTIDTIDGSTVTAASFRVPMDTIHSDKSQRDAQFDGRIMDVARYPEGTFALTAPIDLDPVPAENTVRDYPAHGNLTLHGTTKAVTFTLRAELRDGQIEVSGQIPVPFSDYGIANPSFAGFVTTQDHGTLEFLLVFAKAPG